MNIELIKESIAAADVVSFDIFDTLIFRIVNETGRYIYINRLYFKYKEF